jgi:heterotetrameric sarcosine oxidase gamma subunit
MPSLSNHPPAHAQPGVIAELRRGLGIARVVVRKSKAAELAQQFQDRFGIALPSAPRRVQAGDMAALGVGPGSWLVTAEKRCNDLALSLKPLIGSAAAICDQSDAYIVLRLTGAKLRSALSKLVPLDMHAHAFKAGDVAHTIASHTGILLWRLEDEDEAGQLPVIEMAVARSSSASLHHALSLSAAEFGWRLISA